MRIMLLGWNKPFLNQESTEITSIYTAEALAKWVKVSLVLPQSDLAESHKNMEVTGLNNLNLETMPVSNPKSETFPFANQNIAPTIIPLYGTPVYMGQEIAPNRQKFSGEAVTAGSFLQEPGQKNPEQPTKLNFFHLGQFDLLSLNTQVIQYARYAIRFASHKSFDLIFAHDLPTFLAGTELKLRTGKKLAVQVSGLSSSSTSRENQGWLYEIEKYTFEKSDVVIAEDKIIAAELKEKYNLNQKKIVALQPKAAKTIKKKTAKPSISVFENNRAGTDVLQKSGFLDLLAAEILAALFSLSFSEQHEEI